MKIPDDIRFVTEEEFARMSPSSFDPLAIYENKFFSLGVAKCGIRDDFLRELKNKYEKQENSEYKKMLAQYIADYEKTLAIVKAYEKEMYKEKSKVDNL